MVEIQDGMAEAVRISLSNYYVKNNLDGLLKACGIAKSFSESQNMNLDWSSMDEFAKIISSKEAIEGKLKGSRDGDIYLEIWQKNEFNDKLTETKSRIRILEKDLENNIILAFEQTEVLGEDFRLILKKSVGLSKEEWT
jgi:hypothetical protein